MVENTKTLIIDDDERIRFFLKEALSQIGHQVFTVANGQSALDILRDTYFDLVFLDLNLGSEPGGLRLLEMIKWRWADTAVIILTAYGSMDSALAAIREGVEGYLLKPASIEDIRQAAQKAIERRKGHTREKQPQKQVLQQGTLSVDLEKHLVSHDGKPVQLTASEFRLLAHLVKNGQRVCSPNELVKVTRDYDVADENEAREIIKWYIHQIRQKLGDPKCIVNVRGIGYRLGECR